MTTIAELQSKEVLRDRVSADVAAFVAGGGIIERPVYAPINLTMRQVNDATARARFGEERDEGWALLRSQGRSYAAIAKMAGVSRQCVQQAVQKLKAPKDG